MPNNKSGGQSPMRQNVSRRRALRVLAGAGAAYVAAPMIMTGRYQLFAASEAKYSRRAVDLVERSLVIDMLSPVDLKKVMSIFMEGSEEAEHSRRNPAEPSPYFDKDIVDARLLRDMKASGINVFHHSVGTGADHASLFKYFNDINGMIANNTEDFTRVDSVADLERIKASGKIGVILGTQNADHFHYLHPEHVQLFYRAGQRVAQLTYNARNLIGTGATDRNDDGLSDWGVSAVQEMNRLGMAIDVSHCGDRTSLDAAEVSSKPILITHSNPRAMAGGHPRCKPDDVIKAVCAKGGVMGLTIMRIFVRDRDPVTLEHLLDQYEYMTRLVGNEHLGIGTDSDMYGYDKLPAPMLKRLYQVGSGKYRWREGLDIPALDHPQRTFDLVEGLIRRKYSNEAIEGILGGNFKRVLKQIWR